MAAFAAFLAPFFWWSLLTTTSSEGTVLDPSMYLLPSPPLTTHDDPGLVWSQPSRVTRDAGTHTYANEKATTSTESSESMEGAETFWPSLRTSYGLGGIHIPMTFSVSGTYGNGYHGYGTGVVGSSYGSLFGNPGTGLRTGVAGTYGSISADDSNTFGNYGKSSLAGSSYGSYGSYPGVRVFGNPGKTGWSGWGNGKWGHYGKG